ncbi:Gfo/Idh/MocA family protein [Lactococcus termiticola]|uniref:Inositol 2-dehydrogenase n=1 Tax=Lactococcus termiticola TaxID=2169526 RepID=A0A2R5HFW1_9LACT|nr:Gfo/Idh/MocA family oxidoreductase [Lactococcus termiticola]GBG96947.1 inositol 2-dehydrogenase [Lactococcus termiticola]
MTKIKIASIGLGRLGMVHTQHLSELKEEVELLASFALDDAQLDYAKEHFGIKPYKDWKKMIDEEPLDAIVITSPTAFHPEMTTYALNAGLHVFCEKPLGINMDAVEEMVHAVKDHPNQIFQLGFMRRFDPSYQEAKRMLDAGELGEILYLRAYGIDPISGMESFVKFASDNDSGGVFLDMAIHDIDLVRWFTGQNPKKVWAVTNSIAEPKLEAIGEVDIGVANLEFERGMMATIVAGRSASHGNHVEFEIMGSKGWIRIGQEANPHYSTLFTQKGIVKPYMQSFPERFSQAFVAELKAFAEAVKVGSPSEIGANLEDGLESLKIAEVAKISAEKDEIVSL